ncbi:nucleolar protein 12 [Abrus precatorius]|uniref:Nucleolar protein 12 n=1 Tax=Abrus precatorius TaxID=3816 RepID=A0A8B8KWA4_ABRPR|nr:nucleolar protein 12 [Abrus precatorius]
MEEEAVQRRGGHLKKRALKNKALGISFNEKDLRDYVTGFHKRKKKRRKEAHKLQQEALRRKRTEDRKKRKLEREFVICGGLPPNDDDDEIDENPEEVTEQVESIAGTKTYESADVRVTVVTSEINPEEENYPSERKEAAVSPHSVVAADKRHGAPINNRKSFKKVAKQRSRSKTRSKGDKKKGKKRGKK